MKILSWNVAGIRACIKKGGLDFLAEGQYDIVCFQETKAEEKQVKLPEVLDKLYPSRVWNSTDGVTQRKGLSGTSIWSKTPPLNIIPTMPLDTEGRITALEFEKFNIVTVYTPNSQSPTSERFLFRVGTWDTAFRSYVESLNKIKPTILCGDFNVAIEEIDLHSPDKSRNVSAGFLDEERTEFSKLLEGGYIDTFRLFCKEPNQYTYWDQKIPAFRKHNKGWRIDYFLVPPILKSSTKSAGILPEQLGSDHCPTTLELEFKKKPKLKIVEKLEE